jgi:hypothetical protein
VDGAGMAGRHRSGKSLRLRRARRYGAGKAGYWKVGRRQLLVAGAGMFRVWVFVLGRLLALLFVMVSVCGLAACAARPTRDALVPVEKPPRYTPKVDMLVATTREMGQAGDPTSFSTAISNGPGRARRTLRSRWW